MAVLKERAEDLGFDELKNLNLVREGFVQSLKYRLSPSFEHNLFLLGPKGTGKTVFTMRAISEMIHEDRDILPAMFIFRQGNRMESIDPDRLASKEVWGEKRYEKFHNLSQEELMKESDLIVFDDMHYRCEALMEGTESPKKFISDFKRLEEESEKGKKTVLISEDMLSYYGEKLKMDEFDEILLKFGQRPYHRYVSEGKPNLSHLLKYEDRLDHSSFIEISPFEYEEVLDLFDAYNVKADDSVKEFLFRSSPNPRAFVRFSKLFQIKDRKVEIPMEKMVSKAAQLLPERTRSAEELRFYNYLLNFPVINLEIREAVLEKIPNIVIRGRKNYIEEMYQNLRIIEGICRDAREKLTTEEDYRDKKILRQSLSYFLFNKRKKNPTKTLEAIRDAIEKRVEWSIPKGEEMKMAYLVEKYISSPRWLDKFLDSYETFKGVKLRLETINERISGPEEYFNKLICNIPRHYTFVPERFEPQEKDVSRLIPAYWLLKRPFQVAFGHVLYEVPTIDILESYTGRPR